MSLSQSLVCIVSKLLNAIFEKLYSFCYGLLPQYRKNNYLELFLSCAKVCVGEWKNTWVVWCVGEWNSMGAWVGEWPSGWACEPMRGWVCEWLSVCMGERVSGWAGEQLREWVGESITLILKQFFPEEKHMSLSGIDPFPEYCKFAIQINYIHA